MGERADCIVIGGGITGVSIAYHLTRFDVADVVLLEKDYLDTISSAAYMDSKATFRRRDSVGTAICCLPPWDGSWPSW